ncbi:MAG: MAPEG family protein [Pseudolabrys sp.]
MSIPAVLLPLFVQVALTLGLLLWLGYLRRNDLKSGKVKVEQIALREPNWTVRTQQVVNCFANQFELPVLFYVLTILEIITRQADLIFLILAWVFVLTRLMHALVHTTSIMVMRRGAWYGFGAVALLVMWIIFMVRILYVLP